MDFFNLVFLLGLFIIGYLIIFFSADIFLDNLKEICIFYKVSPFIIGLLILGIDPEETIASIVSAFNNLPYIAVGNVIGNSIISLTLCFGLAAIFYEIKIKNFPGNYFFLIFFSLVTILISFLISFGLLISGIICLIMYIVYLTWSIRSISKISESDQLFSKEIYEEEEEEEFSKYKKFFFILISLILIIIGGEFLIFATDQLITLTHISESIFGFIIIAFMTNVEEITLIIKSIKKQSTEIGIGGMIGKIIWNLTITFGISGIIAINIIFDWNLIWNWIILTILVIYFYVIYWKKTLNRKDGIILMIIFVIFLILNLMIPIRTKSF